MSSNLASWPRRPGVSRGELLLLALVAIPVVGTLGVQASAHGRPWALALVVVALSAVRLRGRTPAAALGLATGTAMVFPDDGAMLAPLLVVLYALAVADGRAAAIRSAALAVLAILSGAALWGGTARVHGGLGGLAFTTTASFAAAVALGLYVGAHRRELAALRDRAESAERERELEGARAVAEERIRIARELHDVVAHDVSLMVVQAQALAATVGDPRVQEGTEAIAGLGREALSEMHRTLRLLRSDGTEVAEREPLPGLGDLDRLLERSRAAGIDLSLSIEGRPHPLDQAADLSAYRVIQEAVTNVVKHAQGAPAAIDLRYGGEELEVRVVDRGEATGVAGRSGGHGLAGMRERVALFGGALSAGRLPGGGFEVMATFPYRRAEA